MERISANFSSSYVVGEVHDKGKGNLMKILVPLSRREYIDAYIDAGADEFYLGFHDDEWERRFGKYADINRMSGFGTLANPYSFDKAIDVVKEIKDKGRRAYITINAATYSPEQLDFVKEHYLPRLKAAGADGVIVSDISSVNAAIQAGIEPVASTMCGIYNSDIAAIYHELGVRRMILPRDLAPEELESICGRFPDVEFEAFFMRNGCLFSDGYCLGMHRPECGALCTYTRSGRSEYIHDYTAFAEVHDVEVNDYLYRTALLIDACGMCALYRLGHAGLTSLKIVGRADDCRAVCRDIALTRRNIDIMENSRSEQEYLERMEFPPGYPGRCRMGLSCYYPQVRFGSTSERHS